MLTGSDEEDQLLNELQPPLHASVIDGTAPSGSGTPHHSQASFTVASQPVSSSHTAEPSSHPQPLLERSNLNVDEFLLEAEAQENHHLTVWNVHFNQTAFSSHMEELDFNTATPAGKLSAETLCSLTTRVLKQMGKEKGVKTIRGLTLPCVSLSYMQNASQKIAGAVPPSLHIKEFVIPFTTGEIPNDKVQTFSITTVAENLSTCHPLCLSFVATDRSTPPGYERELKAKLSASMSRKGWNPKITYSVCSPEGTGTITTLTDPPYSTYK